MSSFFSSNPFSSPVGQRIERATDENQASEDWALNIEICDIINETDDGPKDAMKAVKKRLNSNKKWKEVLLTLTVLETCVKNCGNRFHLLVADKHFAHLLVKLIQPSGNPPTVVQDRVLSLIQTWADAFRGQSDLKGIGEVYQELKQKGIEFPATDLDNLPPIYTPERSAPEVDPATPPQAATPQQCPQTAPAVAFQPAYQPPALYPQQQPPPMTFQPPPPPPGPVTLNREQMAKLRRELDIVLENVKVMSDILNLEVPGQSNPSDLQLVKDLNSTCRAMQRRVMGLFDQVANEEVIAELLRVNDDLNNIFVRYDRFERSQAASQAQPAGGDQATPGPPPLVPIQQQQQQQPQPFISSERPPSYQQAQTIPGLVPQYVPQQPPAMMAQPAPPAMMAQPAPPAMMPQAMPTTPATAGQSQAAPTAALIDFDVGTGSPPPVPQNTPSTGVGMAAAPGDTTGSDLQQQLASLDLSSATVGSTLAGLEPVPPIATAATGQQDPAFATFDMFAQSRQNTYQESMKSGSNYEDNTNIDQSGGTLAGLVHSRGPFSSGQQQPQPQPGEQNPAPPQEVDEMEQWLAGTDLHKPADPTAAANTNPEQTITSSEFDKFLAERAAAADVLPNINQSGSSLTGAAQPAPPAAAAAASNRRGRQLQQDEENSLFAL